MPITLDFRPDVETLQIINSLMNTPLGADPVVRKGLTLSAATMLELITNRAIKQSQLVDQVVVPSLKNVLQRDGSGVGGD